MSNEAVALAAAVLTARSSAGRRCAPSTMARPASYTPIGSPYDVPLVLQARTDSVEGRTVRSSDEIVAALEESLHSRFAV